ncbi:MAG: ABC transporter permease [Desulforhabdus sp.]|jgi:simple sugar transport system permease protein|nr:ABC transporter permease [Desulforhabdus sp.]
MNILQLLTLTLGKTTPVLLACMGGLLSELSGVINFALEGMMLTGAFFAVWLTYSSGSPWIGLLGAAAGGTLIGILHSLVCLRFRANQIVSSIALNLLAAGASGMLLNQVFQVYGTSPTVEKLPALNQLGIGRLPFLGEILASGAGELSILVPLSILFNLALIAFLKWSVWGLRLKACGENPLAAKAAGLSVNRIRFLAISTGGALAGVGGAYLAIGELSTFVEQMTQGRGYLAIAALILGRWRPFGILPATLFFGLSGAFSEWLAVRWTGLPYQLFLALPYAVCLGVLLFQMDKKQPPSALGRV